MGISSDLVYNKELNVLKVTGLYPKTENCYQVEISDAKTKEILWVSDHFPKPAYKFYVKLKSIKDVVSRSTIEELIILFNDYGDWKYSEAYDDASMNTEDN